MALEQALDPTLGDTQPVSDLRHRPGIVDVLLDQRDGGLDVRVELVGGGPHGMALWRFADPDGVVQGLVRNLRCDLGAVPLGDEVQHEIQARGPARAGHHRTVGGEYLLAYRRVRELLGEPGQDGPVGGREPVAQQSRAGQKIGAGLQRDQCRPAAGLAAQPLEQGRGPVVLASPATADQHDVERPAGRLDGCRRDRHTVAGRDRSAVRGPVLPLEQRLRSQIVGDAHWLDGCRQRHHVEPGNEHDRAATLAPSVAGSRYRITNGFPIGSLDTFIQIVFGRV